MSITSYDLKIEEKYGNTRFVKYLQSVKYFDNALEKLLEELKKDVNGKIAM